MKNLNELGALELRELAYEKYIGRSGDIRKLKKSQLVRMLEDDIDLDVMLQENVDELEGIIQTPQPQFGNGEAQLGAMLASLVQSHIKTPQLNMELIRQELSDTKDEILATAKAEIEKAASQVKTINLDVKLADVTIPMGTQHYLFEKLLKLISLRLNVMMVGPAGSGKTTAAEKAAEALSLPFYAISVGPQTSKTDFLGYMDANGKYVQTNFRRAYESGGVFIVDEIDAGNSGVMTIINAATSNGQAGFPDGMVSKHKDFICVAAANTYGRGADRQYVGRQQMDAATLNRFAVIDWDYDEAFEVLLSGNKKWATKVQKIRKIVEDMKIRHVVSPRASINGAKMLQAGFSEGEVLEIVVYQGLDEQSKQKIASRL